MSQNSDRLKGSKVGGYIVPPKHNIAFDQIQRSQKANESKRIYDGKDWKEVTPKAYSAAVREQREAS